jgi:hypothetical protein
VEAGFYLAAVEPNAARGLFEALLATGQASMSGELYRLPLAYVPADPQRAAELARSTSAGLGPTRTTAQLAEWLLADGPARARWELGRWGL